MSHFDKKPVLRGGESVMKSTEYYKWERTSVGLGGERTSVGLGGERNSVGLENT